MEWDHLFSGEILREGQELWSEDRVELFYHEKDTYNALVHADDVMASVKVVLMDKGRLTTTCTCRSKSSGLLCSHIAATLLEISNMKKAELEKSKEIEETVDPFKGLVSNENYSLYNLQEILSDFEFSKSTYEEAKKFIKSGAVKVDEIKSEYVSQFRSRSKQATARGVLQTRNTRGILKAVVNDTSLQGCACGVPGCGHRYDASFNYSQKGSLAGKKQTLCSHLLAFLMVLQVVFVKQNPGDATDHDGDRVLKGFRSRRISKMVEDDEELKTIVLVEPKIVVNDEGVELALRVGTDKMYVCKNLSELVEVVENKEKLSLGVNNEIDFAFSRFAEASQKYYDFVKRIIKSEEIRSGEKFGANLVSHKNKISNRIKLFGSDLDNFFDIVNGKRIGIEKNGGERISSKAVFLEKNPEVEFTVYKMVDSVGVFHGVELCGYFPTIYEGMDYRYFLNTLCSPVEFCRMKRDMEETIEPFLEIVDPYSNYFTINIGRKNMSEFYYRVLPGLKEWVEVNEFDKEYINSFLPPEAEFAFYIDAEGENITCEVKVNYGAEEYDISEVRNKAIVQSDLRDENQEKYVLSTVMKFFPKFNQERKIFHCDGDEELRLEILENGVGTLLELGTVHTTDAFRSIRIKKSTKLSLGISVESNIMNLEIQSEDLTQEELLDILYNYQRKKKYYKLKSGDFLRIQQESLDELSKMLETLHITPKEFVTGKMQLPLYRSLYLDKLLEQNEDIYARRDHEYKSLVKGFKIVKDSEFDIPESVHDIMRGYQKYGHRWLRTIEKNNFGGILADDMGLGKTLQIISVLQACKNEREDCGTSLVIAPASLVYNWQSELYKFAPELKVGMVAGKQSDRFDIIKKYKDYDVLITSYDLIKRDIAEYEEKEFYFQIIDEAQYIKNHATITAKAVKVINSRIRYALTGTPIENRLSELWSIFDFLMPGFLYDYQTFRNEFEIPIVKEKDLEVTDQLKRMVAPFILRRLKREVLKDLPDKIEEVYYAQMDTKQQRLYDGQVVNMRQMLEGCSEQEFSKKRMQVLAELMRTRQICCDPNLVVNGFDGGSAKREACLELINSAIEGEHKMLIFSQFTSMLELLEKDLTRAGIKYYKITGETTKEKRIKYVNTFNSDDTPVFLISLKAGGTGLNLTGADIVIHYDPWWNAAVMNQATDRAHRLGQTKVVSVYKLIVKDSIEEKIMKLQETKKDLADQILSGELGTITNLSQTELLDIIS